MIVGAIGSVGDGLQYPLSTFVLSFVMNDYGNPDQPLTKDIVDKYALKLLCVAIGVGVSAFVEGICWTRTAERQTSRIRMEYLRSVLRQEVGFFDTQDGASSSTTYQVVSTISNDANSIQVAICDKIPNSIAYGSASMACIVVAFVVSWRLALAALPLTLLFLVPCLTFGKLMTDALMKKLETYGVAGGIAEQAISSIRTVYSYVAEQETVNKFRKALENSLELGIKQGLAKGIMMGCIGIIYLGWAFQSWFGAYLVTEKGEKGGSLFVASVNVIMAGMSIMSVLPNIASITEATDAATRIVQMIDRSPHIDSEEKKGKALSHVRGEVVFRDIHFCYPSRPDTPVLQGLNLTVPAGQTVGLVGGSGSGKSTIISLLQRFYDPVGGEILLDGHTIKKLQLKWLRSQMGLVNQEPVLFATSIKENILFGKEGASADDVVDAAKAANAHDFIVKLPDGYDTQVGQFGFQMSGGQKQRIAIARALIREPKILLLDEATSALDTQSERLVQAAIDQASKGRTTITIAHRLSTIRNAHLIIVLRAGRVVEAGSHEELTTQENGGHDGEYLRMLTLQQTIVQKATPGRYSWRLTAPGTPLSNLSTPRRHGWRSNLSSPTSIGTPYSYSIEYDISEGSDDEDEDYYENYYPAPSQWRLLKMNAPEWKAALIGCTAAIGGGASQSINAYFVGLFVSTLFGTDKDAVRHKCKTLSFIFLGLAALNFTTSLLQHYSFAVMGEKLTKRVREKLLGKLLTFEIGWFDEDDNNSAAVCARLATEANMVRSLVGDRISLLVQAFFGTISAYILALALSWRLGLVMLAVQPIVMGSYYSRAVVTKSMAGKARKAQKEGSQIASEAVINHRTITAFSSQKRIQALFRSTLRGPKEESVRHSWLSGLGLFSSQFCNTASIALGYWYGGRLLADGKIEAVQLFQSYLAIVFSGYVIAEAGSMTSDISKGRTAVKAVFKIMDRKTEIEPDSSSGGFTSRREMKGKIKMELKDVYFAYPTRPDQMILKGLNLKIEPGRTVALVGPSGSGKSTIIGLMERFYDPLRGAVFIDGKDVSSYNLRWLRSHIALVSQEPSLFAGSIRENIAYGKQDAQESEIQNAAIQANAHEFISGMKEGYDTYCGERGVQLSGGQKQRVALARAILKNPLILLLDEATSALDSVSEKLVQEALEKMMVGRTCVVVAHRLSTIQKSDSIAVIKNGEVAEKGPHNELMSLGHRGVYYSLVRPQQPGITSPFRP
ncbi:Putative multidrug resistance protein [Linum perenne]